MLDRGVAGFSESAYQKLELENSTIDNVLVIAGRVTARLDQTILLLQVREVMVDKRDRAAVSGFLSIVSSTVAKASRSSVEAINRSLIRISRPGIAADVAKLRDRVSDVLAAFENCAMPQRQQ